MGFRFRRSIKIAKGLRLNVSGGGLSLSVGGRGATVNLSSRGTRATVGIPGTGLSWSGNLSSTSRPARAPSAAAQARDAARAARAEASQAAALAKELRQLEAQEAELRDEEEVRTLVDGWRQIAMNPPAVEEYENALAPRPFDEKQLPPRQERRAVAKPTRPLLDLASERATHHDRILQRLALQRFKRISFVHFAAAGIVGGALGAGLSILGDLNSVAFAVLGLVAFSLPVYLFGESTERKARLLAVQEEFAASWPGLESTLTRQHEAQCHDAEARYRDELERASREHEEVTKRYEQHAASMRHAWRLAEERRLALLTKLIEGDAEQSAATLSASLEALDFPFETDVEFHVDDDGRSVDVLVDLPEIEDCIPEKRQKAQKNGTTREVRRTKAERFALYATLVIGLGVAIATRTFCVLPAARSVRLAAFTQRRARGTSTVEDQFIYEMTLPREEAEDLDLHQGPFELLRFIDCRMDLDPSGNFRKLAPPAWLSRVRADSPES